MRKFILFLLIILPNPIKLFIYRKFFGWEIGNNVRIGFSYIDSKSVRLEGNVKIGNFNVIKNLKSLKVGEYSNLGNLNHIAGNQWDDNWKSSLIIGNKVDITSGHVLDVGGGVFIGDNVTLAGIYTQIWSHEKDLAENEFITKPVHIGSYVYIGSNALLAPGVVIPSNTVVGLGTVVPSKLQSSEGSLIVGNPACVKTRKKVSGSSINGK